MPFGFKYKKLHATCGMEFLGMGNRASGMGKKLPMPNPLFGPSGGATVPEHATCGMEFPVAFNERVRWRSHLIPFHFNNDTNTLVGARQCPLVST
ncbi:hypothetical protein LC653_38365 [Nostoc sp. CHAB 5784]|uniref:hypothetical protein n=1 Tax=Nostoc mirabile TaxID=2907820 RepID=UPI001E3F78E4|nr:hypothetical protein [Nostoc mirabile]MCC5669532.1 hypothetical protein [Nostoc mirabile CHAB5784]